MQREVIDKLFKLIEDSDLLNDMLLILQQDDASICSPQINSSVNTVGFYMLNNDNRMKKIKGEIAHIIREERKSIEKEIDEL